MTEAASAPPTDAPAIETPPSETPPSDLPDFEPLTPELVEDEAIRGDFMLRWGVILLAMLLGCRQLIETPALVHLKTGLHISSKMMGCQSLSRFSERV